MGLFKNVFHRLNNSTMKCRYIYTFHNFLRDPIVTEVQWCGVWVCVCGLCLINIHDLIEIQT